MARSRDDVAKRLELTRAALNLSAAELCRRSGIKPNQWLQYVGEGDKRRITIEAARKLRDAFGLTLDWIYEGDASGLPHKLAVALREAQAA